MNYLNFLIKKRFTDNLKALLPVIVVGLILALLDYLELFQLTDSFGEYLNYICSKPCLAIIPVLLLILCISGIIKIYSENFIWMPVLKGKSKAASTREFGWTKKFGSIAPFLQQDLKLIWRNKRPKTTIYLSLIIIRLWAYFLSK